MCLTITLIWAFNSSNSCLILNKSKFVFVNLKKLDFQHFSSWYVFLCCFSIFSIHIFGQYVAKMRDCYTKVQCLIVFFLSNSPKNNEKVPSRFPSMTFRWRINFCECFFVFHINAHLSMNNFERVKPLQANILLLLLLCDEEKGKYFGEKLDVESLQTRENVLRSFSSGILGCDLVIQTVFKCVRNENWGVTNLNGMLRSLFVVKMSQGSV